MGQKGSAVLEMLNERGIDMKKVVSVATDGAPAMMGRERTGWAAESSPSSPDILSLHNSPVCLLCKSWRKLLGDHGNNDETQSFWEHHLHCSMWCPGVRSWSVFGSLRMNCMHFCQSKWVQKQNCTKKNMEAVAFLTDISSHLNNLNVKLQGKNNTVCELMSAVWDFQRKLQVGC